MTIKHFDDVLDRLKTGKWNYTYFYVVGGFCFMIPSMVIGGAFLSPNIAHNCTKFSSTGSEVLPSTGTRDQCEQMINRTLPNGHFELEISKCEKWEYDTKEFSITVTSEFNLVCDRAYLRPTFQTVYMIGTFLGSLFFGYMADMFGRKRIVCIGVIGIISSSVLSSFMNSFEWILFLRFITGSFHPSVYQSGMVLCMEVCENKHRSAVGMMIAVPWAFGTMWFGYLGYLVRDWRWLQRLSIAPAIITIPLLIVIDESPRWLIVKGRFKEALKALKNGAKKNGASLPSDEELRESMILIQKSARSIVEQSKEGKRTVKELVKDKVNSAVILLKTPELRKRSLLTFYIFFASSTVFYGLSLNAVNFNVNPYLYMFIGGVMEVPAYIAPVPIIQRFGRIRPMVLFYIVCGVTIMALAFISGDIRWLVIIFAMTGKLCIAAAYQLVYLVGTEIFPTEVRTQALGTGSFVSRIGSIAAPYITDSIGFEMKWLPSIVFGSLSLSAGVVSCFMPETLKARLYDTVLQMEDDCAARSKEVKTNGDSSSKTAVKEAQENELETIAST